MEYSDLLFKRYLAANLGDNVAMWHIIKKFEKYIDKVCNGNTDMKHTIILSLFDLSSELNTRFQEYFKEINS